jgi:hypothetical protein
VGRKFWFCPNTVVFREPKVEHKARVRDFEQCLESTALHSVDQFEDRAIRILEADHADRGTVRPLDLLERRRTLDLLCLQIRVRPVDIVDAEDDAADADVVGVR